MPLDTSALKAICFDLDHTLFDRELAMRHYLESWLERHGHEQEPALVTRALEVDRAGYAPRRVFNQWWAGEMLERGEVMTMDAFWQDFKQHLSAELAPDSEVSTLLRDLAARFDIALVTNGGAENQRAKITALELDEIFSDTHIIVSDEVDSWKPEPEIFHIALRRLGTKPEETLFVGDDPAHDIAGAGHLGFQTCWVSRGRAWPERVPHHTTPNQIIEDVLALAEIL